MSSFPLPPTSQIKITIALWLDGQFECKHEQPMLELGNFVRRGYSPKGAKQNMEEGEGRGRRPHLHEPGGHPKTGQSECTFVDAEVSDLLINHEVTDPNMMIVFSSSVRSSRGNFSVGKSSDSGVHDLPGGHVSRGSIAGDSISIIFDLAVPDAAPVVTSERQMVRDQSQSNISPDSTREGPDTSDKMGPVYQISGTR